MRMRIRYNPCRPALLLTDTPRPDCRACHGQGGHNHDYGHPETGEYEGTEWEPCPCWDDTRTHTLLPLPRIRLPRHKHRTGQPTADPWDTGGNQPATGDQPSF
ncbi:hypothetical protein [Streptomyces sp. AA1529]|uniref:hypothetical protein n=1 Tax=Streptomyces sp. AA1529 TaxID=1203257 RepID=UPI003D727B70